MEDPVREIAPIILSLTTTPPSTQRQTLDRYFLPDASFDHPLCAVDGFVSPLGSRSVILAIYRWYKILSPVIELQVESIAFDERTARLYVDATQIFTFWFLPWIRIPAELVTVLQLEKRRIRPTEAEEAGGVNGDTGVTRWFIRQQKDLYQTEQWLGFLPVFGLLLRKLWSLQKRIATLACVVGAVFFTWIGLMETPGADSEPWSVQARDKAQEVVLGRERKIMGRIGERKRK